jgi:hypothetical protein
MLLTCCNSTEGEKIEGFNNKGKRASINAALY